MWIYLAGSSMMLQFLSMSLVSVSWMLDAHEAPSLVGQFKVKRQSSGKPTCLLLSVQFSPQVIGRMAGASIAAFVRHIVKFAAVAPAAALSGALDGCFALVGMFLFLVGLLASVLLFSLDFAWTILQATEEVRQQAAAAAAWFVFFVAMFCVWCCAGQWHVLGLRIQRAAHTVEMTVCARLQRPSFRCGHVLGLRIWEATHGASSALCDRFGWPPHCLVATTPSPLDVITAFGTQCASATPRVDVDAVMTGLGESLWLENMQSHEGGKEKEEEERKETSTEKKDLGCVPVYIRSLTGRTLKLLISPHDDVLTLLSLIEGFFHIPRHLWYARANGKPLPDLSMPHGLLRDDIVTMHGRLAGGAPPPRVPGGVVLPGVSAWRVLAGEIVLFSVWTPSQGV